MRRSTRATELAVLAAIASDGWSTTWEIQTATRLRIDDVKRAIARLLSLKAIRASSRAACWQRTTVSWVAREEAADIAEMRL